MFLLEETNRDQTQQKKPDRNKTLFEDDRYGLFKQELEVDTDVNEDPNRERLLDESFHSFLGSLKKND
jgi:hypothetical protein